MLNIGKKKTQNKLGIQNEISLFLRRRRIELGIKLDELSDGICSTSYLSRIENNQVDVDSSYYEALFEKMNIDYEVLKENRSRNLYHEILECYINDDVKSIESILNHSIKSKCYIDTEIDLFLLFYNILTSNYEEARKILIKLDSIKKGLSNYELLFFMFSFALYTYRTNQNKKAYQQMLLLNEIDYEDSVIESCIYDLGIEIMLSVGMDVIAWDYYHQLESIASYPLFRERMILNNIKLLSCYSEIDGNNVIDTVIEYSKSIDLSKNYNRENYYYYLGLIYYLNNEYEEIINLYKDNILSARCSIILASVCFNNQNKIEVSEILSNINDYKYNKYETYFLEYIKFINLYTDSNSDFVLLNYIKNILFHKSNFYFDFIEEMKIKKYIPLLLSCGKYKEATREFIKYLNTSKHKKLI